MRAVWASSSRETQRLGSLYRACGAPAWLGSGTLWPSYAGKPRLSIQRRYGFSFGSSVQPIVPSKLGGALGLLWRTATAISSNDGDGLSMPNVPGGIAFQDFLCWLSAKQRIAWSSELLCTHFCKHASWAGNSLPFSCFCGRSEHYC